MTHTTTVQTAEGSVIISKTPTRLAQVKAELHTMEDRMWTEHMCLYLALTTEAQWSARVDDPTCGHYVIDGYGLKRADGGYVVIRFVHPHQTDSIRAFRADVWIRDAMDPFHIAASQLNTARYNLNRSV